MICWMDEVKKYENEIIALISQWVSIPSVYDETTISENAPFGKGVHDALQFIMQQAKKDNFAFLDDEGYACHIDYGSGEEIVGVLGHADVVPEGDGWTDAPFSGKVANGRIYGRGTQDDKGPLISAYIAMKVIRDLGLPISKKIRMIIGGNEERDWQCVDHYFKKYPQPTLGFTPDGNFPLVYAEKVINVYEYKGMYKDDVILSFNGGNAANSVCDRASACLQIEEDAIHQPFLDYLKKHQLQGTLETKEYLTVEIEGVSSHGSTPEVGVNAAVHLLQFLAQNTKSTFAQHFAKVFAQYDGSGLGIAYQDDEMGSLSMNLGMMKYEDGFYTFTLDLRYPMAVDREWLHATMMERGCMAAFQTTCELVSFKEGIYLDRESKLIKTLYKAYVDQTHDVESKPMVMGGGTYARAASNLVCFGMLFPDSEELFHQKNESVSIDDVLKATAIYAQALYELAK